MPTQHEEHGPDDRIKTNAFFDRSDEHPSHQRHQYRRKEDREREVEHQSYIARMRDEPLTINKLVMIMSVFFAFTQAAAWWRSNNVTPEALRETNTRVERLAVVVDSLTNTLKEKKKGDNFFYYSICYSWRLKFPSQYPAFCDNPDIQQFDPLGRPIPTPR